MNFNEHLKSILGSQIMCINIYTSLASAQRNSFIARSNAKLDFSFPLVFIYILHIWLKITCLKPNPLLLSAYTYTHTHTYKQTYDRIFILAYRHLHGHVCIYTYIFTARSLSAKTIRQEFSPLVERKVCPLFSYLPFTNSQHYSIAGFLWKEGCT